MQLDGIFLKYIPIFNWMGESCVTPSDFRLSNPSSNKRRVINISIFVSFSITTILTIFNVASHINTFSLNRHTLHVVFLLIYFFRINTKICCMGHLRSWLVFCPKIYSIFKDIQRITERRYKMNFSQFETQFDKEVSILCVIWLIKLIIYILIFWDSALACIMTLNESIVLISSYSTFFHLYFYVLLFSHMISIFNDYIERKAIYDKPKTLADLKSDLSFIKIVHLKFYAISKVLNDAFGWIFVFLFNQKFTEIIGDAFWTYTNLSCTNMFVVIRKYALIFLIFFFLICVHVVIYVISTFSTA